MIEQRNARIVEMALNNQKPSQIAAELRVSIDVVKHTLVNARKSGLDVPRFGTRPDNPKMPASGKKLFCKEIDPFIRATVVALRSEGQSQRTIAQNMKLSLGFVQKTLNHHKKASA